MQLKFKSYLQMKWLYLIEFSALLLASVTAFSQDDDRDARLMVAADQGDTATAKLLILSGAHVNATTYEGVSALMYAAQNGYTEMVKLLIQMGADPDLKPAINGHTALISAIRSGYIETAEYLVRNGADINLADNDEVTPLMHAIAIDSFYMPDMLLYYDARVDAKDEQGINALMLASWLDRYEIVFSLLEKGADINSADERNWTPLHYATLAGNTDIMDLLILNDASLESYTLSGHTPLALAVALNNYAAARLLIGYGADVNSRISRSLNPLTIALENKSDSLAGMLERQGATPILKPYFNQFTAGTQVRLNSDDLHLGFSLGVSDKKYNLMMSLGYGVRAKAIRVLEQTSETEYYQFWEKRHLISLSVEKAFYMPLKIASVRPGVFAGFSEVLTFGGYRGSEKNPDVRLVMNPKIGGIFDYRFLRLKIDYELMHLHLTDIKRGWFNFSLEFLFNRNRGTIRTPSIDWL